MLKGSFVLFAIVTLASIVYSQAQPAKVLTAPTFYITASGEYNKYSTTLDVKGASNLPSGSRLSATLYDFVGYGSSILSADAIVVLNKDGFFEVTLKPRLGKQFKENMVCDISLNPRTVRQEPSVLKIIGRNGELLGVDNNPQIGKMSGDNYYLQALVHIP